MHYNKEEFTMADTTTTTSTAAPAAGGEPQNQNPQ